MTQQMLAIWSLVPLPSLNPAWASGSSRFTRLLLLRYTNKRRQGLSMSSSVVTPPSPLRSPRPWPVDYSSRGSKYCPMFPRENTSMNYHPLDSALWSSALRGWAGIILPAWFGSSGRTEVTHLKSQSSLEPVPRSFILSVIFSDEVSALLELLFVNTFAAME